MSHVNNQCILHWQVVDEFLCRRTSNVYDDQTRLPESSRLILKDSYLLWYLCTLDTLASFGLPPEGLDNRWLNAICNCPVSLLVQFLKEGAHQLVTGESPSYDSFKQNLRIEFPFAGAIMAPVKRIIDHWLSDNDTDALYLIYSWFLFLSRLNLPGLPVLEEKALSEYLLTEASLKEGGFPLDEADLIGKWFPRDLEDMAFLIEHHVPSNGPGSTADNGSSTISKFLGYRHDPRLSMLCKRVGGRPLYPRICEDPLVRRSRTIFVPKSLASYRTISMEPSSLMWHQKGVRNAIFSLLKKKRKYLLRRYTPEHQEPNRDLAWLGSIDGSFATIDLSSASDTVSWSMVSEWFRGTSLWPWLLWTRSTHTELPTGEVIKLRKYAPMGSDLCFPIECIVFCAITECAIRGCGADPALSEYRVYGDDIVVEDQYAEAVMRRLVEVGFRVNTDKSFFGTQPRGFFRESCGGFYFNGVDITPTRISRQFDGIRDLGVENPERITRLIDFANDCNNRYPSVRRLIIHKLLAMDTHLRPPFSHEGDVGLFSSQATNFHLRQKVSSS